MAALVGLGLWFLFQRFSNFNPEAGIVNEESGFEPYVLLDPLVVDEPLFTLELPGDWEEIERENSDEEKSITWQSAKSNKIERYLKVYIDTIPRDRAINRLLPVESDGNTIKQGELSYNCITLVDEADANRELPVAVTAIWQGVEFVCNLPDVLSNEIGTGSTDGINTVRVSGRNNGEHEYFLVYSDYTNTPTSTILINAIRSFRAK
jgi:hypothetical protein